MKPIKIYHLWEKKIISGVDIHGYLNLQTEEFNHAKEDISKQIHSSGTQLQNLAVMFFLLLFTYLFSVTGDMTIIMLTIIPMYFSLRNYSFLKILFTTVCISRFLVSITTRDTTTSHNARATQFFFNASGLHRFLSSGCNVL